MTKSKSFQDMLNAHKTKEASKLTEAEKKYRDWELDNALDEILRKNKSVSPDYIEELSLKMFAEAQKRKGSN